MPPRECVTGLQLVLLLTCSFGCSSYNFPPAAVRRNIIKVRASGFLPFESDLLLPLGILRQLQAQDRASRLLPRQPAPTFNKKPKHQLRLERAQLRGHDAASSGVKLYNLIDDDGELLLNLRVHNDVQPQKNFDAMPEASGAYQRYTNTLDADDNDTPWLPSNWRPTTTAAPRALTSSSPRPLPLRQYIINSNSIEQQTQKQPQRRHMLRASASHDWAFK
ncbi:uncharacterized protein LOC115629333 [Scaptodrosophila lebanonensis]|uniref:Uncharacterized protein LOC115629333 n=1 Tax=Drosophila lebanonensis TaxID=7225 RepID=A0A6J2TYN6_DROLE|nr:uncharacterized protein LOC115629333 [Scaptodrosophila lebanonensis]